MPATGDTQEESVRSGPNAEQSKAWNGREGVHWANRTDPPEENAVLHSLLFDAAAIGETARALDIGCGAGRTTLLAARRASAGHVMGIDLSRPMLERARSDQRSEGAANVTFEEGDAQSYPFTDSTFDVAISQFGIMFFADPVAAFANVRRALKPGGRLVFLCPGAMAWCDWYTIPMAALLGRTPQPITAGPYIPGMFSLADPQRTTEVLSQAGFRDITASSHHALLPFGKNAAEAAERYLGLGPVLDVLQRNEDITPNAARNLLTRALEPHAGPDGVRLGGPLWLVTAHRPHRRS